MTGCCVAVVSRWVVTQQVIRLPVDEEAGGRNVCTPWATILRRGCGVWWDRQSLASFQEMGCSERQSVPTRWWWWLVGTIKRSNARHDNEGTVGETRVRHQLQAQVGTKLSNEGKFWEVLVQMLEVEGICSG